MPFIVGPLLVRATTFAILFGLSDGLKDHMSRFVSIVLAETGFISLTAVLHVLGQRHPVAVPEGFERSRMAACRRKFGQQV